MWNVENQKKIENGVILYSAKDGHDVLVVSPLLWIEADTPCHSELCSLLDPTTLYPCRKCYVLLRRGKNSLKYVNYCTSRHNYRTNEHYLLASSNPTRNTMIMGALGPGADLPSKSLSHKDRGTDVLSQLGSFDPSKDTPVEILHCILLRVAKYLVNDLVKVILKGHPREMSKLDCCLRDYQNSKGLSRNFTKELRHCGSFLGRYYKILLQILPVILVAAFAGDSVLSGITACFILLGKLCSLVFVREISMDFDV